MKAIKKDIIEILQFESLKKDNLCHFSTTIKGGVSVGAYTSLNLGLYSGDQIENVVENRNLLSKFLGISTTNLYIPYQTHDDKILIIDDDFLQLTENEREEKLKGIDALITDKEGIAIAVTTADCVPILLFDPAKNIIAAVHAGWKGTVAKIAGKTVAKMVEYYGSKPSDLQAGIAPCISQECFEVGEEVVAKFMQAGFPVDKIGYRNTESGKMHIDLQSANEIILIEAGLKKVNIEIANLCTYSNPDKFFSARRQTIHSGRMITGGFIL
ncbi:MAG: peptidoglycan editing factor PgeF [Dysgonomonas sp.]|nr:peptidoglycan editing factor PgeF [Dysgonomonas sp.]